MLCQFNNNGAHVPAIDLCNGKKIQQSADSNGRIIVGKAMKIKRLINV